MKTEHKIYKVPLVDGGYTDRLTGDLLPSLDGAPADRNYTHNGYTGYPAGALACYDYRDKLCTIAVFDAAPEAAPGEEIVGEEAFLAEIITNCGFNPATTIVDGLPVEPPLMTT